MSPNENGRLLGGRAAAEIQFKAPADSLSHQAAAQPPQGPRAIISHLLSMCLVDRRYCELLERHRCGLVYCVPPLREIHDLERSA